MEKLRPILEQKFWILSVVTLLMVVSGWWLGTGSLSAEYNKRETVLKSLNIPSGNSANGDWVENMQKIFNRKDLRLKQSHEFLIKQQKEEKERYWPRLLAFQMKDKIYKKHEIKVDDLEIYQEQYSRTLEKMRQIAVPFDFETGRGQCELNPETLPQVESGRWDEIAPSSDEVWEVQEDVGLVSSLLHAIADTNGEAKGIVDAPVKVISTLELHGGKRNPDGTPFTGKSSEGGSGTEGGGGESGPSEGESNPFRSGRSSTGSSDGLAKSNVDFDASEDFGDPSKEQSEGGGSDADAGAEGPVSSGGNTKRAERRYVDDDPKMPFKTRGFYLKVIMDRNKIPELIIQLTSLKYPVEILRIHQASLDGKTNFSSQKSTPGGDGRRNAPSPFESPMATGGPMPMGTGGGFGSQTTIKLTTEQEKAKLSYDRALRDPNLSEVVITGLMTIYTIKDDNKDGTTTD